MRACARAPATVQVYIIKYCEECTAWEIETYTSQHQLSIIYDEYRTFVVEVSLNKVAGGDENHQDGQQQSHVRSPVGAGRGGGRGHALGARVWTRVAHDVVGRLFQQVFCTTQNTR